MTGGRPSAAALRYFQRETVAATALSSESQPELSTIFSNLQEPSSPIASSTRTTPWMLRRRASLGYAGAGV